MRVFFVGRRLERARRRTVHGMHNTGTVFSYLNSSRVKNLQEENLSCRITKAVSATLPPSKDLNASSHSIDKENLEGTSE